MSAPVHTSNACRNAILAYTDQIRQTVAAKEPTLAEIEEIGAHCAMVSREARRWHSAERLITAAQHFPEPISAALAMVRPAS